MATSDIYIESTQYKHWRFSIEELLAQRSSLLENANQQKGNLNIQ
jgi:hypothetical protein